MRWPFLAACLVALCGCGDGGSRDDTNAFTGGMVIVSPTVYQVIQRKTRAVGSVRIAGSLTAAHDLLEMRLLGSGVDGPLHGRWEVVPQTSPSHFDTTLDVPAGGWYRLEVRATLASRTVASGYVPTFGIGEVFVGAGQSNSTNFGESKTRSTSGMVAAFDGMSWSPANDPMSGVRDKSTGGSFWPTLGDALYEKYRVPIGVASTGQSGSSVYSWAAREDLYQWTMTRVRQLGPGGFRALLWHQGEADAMGGVSADAYSQKLCQVIENSRKDAGWEIPWMVARATYYSPNHPRCDTVRQGQQNVCDSGVALQGPDTDTLTGDNRFGASAHFSAKGLRAHGNLWAQKIIPYLDSQVEN